LSLVVFLRSKRKIKRVPSRTATRRTKASGRNAELRNEKLRKGGKSKDLSLSTKREGEDKESRLFPTRREKNANAQ